MKFQLKTAGYFYTEAQAAELQKIGFTFEPHTGIRKKHEFAKQDSDIEIEFTTLDELVRFAHKWGDLVITEDTIEIYDNYRE